MDLTKREKIGISIFVLILIGSLIFSYHLNKSKTNIEIISSKNEEEINKEKINYIKVYITGEVKNPGVYSLKEGDRLEKAIELAGGFTENADKNSINLAMKLKDEDFIKVLKVNLNSFEQSVNTINELKNSKININTANKEELKSLPRIGDALAQRIIDYRDKNGPFKRIEDIKKVSGIGEKMFENIKDKITIY
ncbi:transporter [Caloramator sp. E03]|uniref:helix-hairpin-helix domain-containing protein n=1 Tax=Caloramator sp. E03 TaxID=2576307 RepID=UPI0011109CB3|nr:helix-hairpin-helix domain-containing protein [Caloramator sp. E03]QCX32470.1 transporter [Caloramator sp. E03]